MLVFDAHLDLAWNAIDFNRDLKQSVADIRAGERDIPGKGRGRNTVSFPELRRGHVGIFIATLLARQLRDAFGLSAVNRYRNMDAAYAACQGQLAYYRLLSEQGYLQFIKDWPTLETHVKQWHDPTTSAPLGFILSMEGADPILHPEQVDEWYAAGLRIIGPAHYGVSPYAHGTGTVGGLFPPGKPLLKAMERVGMILDVTHLSDDCFTEALDHFGGPVLASHHNCRALVDDQRQLADNHIRRLVERGAVIGTALDAWMMIPGWVRGETDAQTVGCKLELMCDHIDHVCQIAGNAQHAAIGSDLDGGFGTEQTPYDLDTIADLQRVPAMLASRGYSTADIEAIMHGNWLRLFRTAWTKG